MISNKLAWVYSLIAIAATALALGPTVVSCSPSCKDLANCGPYIPPPAGGSAGEAGAADGSVAAGATQGGNGGNVSVNGGGNAGVTSGGATSAGSTGDVGNAGEAGAGGTVPTKPCDGACSGVKPLCDEGTDSCVECLGSKDCTGSKKVCDRAAGACVGCLAASDCKAEKAAKCEAQACVTCTSNDDCAHIAGKTVCDAKAGECVECTGTDYTACGKDLGTPLVCDSRERTCTTNKEQSAGLCQACVADAQCTPGELCMKETFGEPAKDVGYFCFYEQGASGAPVDCPATGRPYVKVLPNQTSIDGRSGTICGLAVSTCPARSQFRAKDCSMSTSADDSKCGFDPGNDSKCQAFGASQFRCTMICGSDDDCLSGFACNAGENPSVCEF